ncbi:MAG: chemotaxis protein CheB, partial [Armatimonadota bacterium]
MKKSETQMEVPVHDRPSYIVGIGASAGGLEALDEFFRHMPSDSGIAFVIIQHLDPTHKGMLPEILQRTTDMAVYEVEDGMITQPNNIYVIPPNKYISILHGTLQLLKPTSPRGTQMPIDYFFRHLADDQGDKSICIILSGMGTDGTLGLKAIKEKLGMTMVQDPASAKYDSMPRSAISTGLVDYIVTTEQLPGKIMEYIQHLSMLPAHETIPPEGTINTLNKIFILLRDYTGHDFSSYKQNTIMRRIQRRMIIHQIIDMSLYVQYLQQNHTELILLFKELLIGVTSFFRDPDVWETLKLRVLPALVDSRKESKNLRAWVAGCSTGEEAYTLAIIMQEILEEQKLDRNLKIQIFASDIDSEAIDHARQGIYPQNISADISPERLERFFFKEDGKYRVCKEIREMITFASQDILVDPPFTRLDILTCRNLLIYIISEMQRKIIPLFYYSLKPSGILLLGTAETNSGFDDMFTTIDDKSKIFRRQESIQTITAIPDFPLSAIGKPANKPPNHEIKKELALANVTRQTILDNFSPSALIVNEQGDILFIHGRTGKYLEPSPGKASLNLLSMANEEIKYELKSAIRKVVEENIDVKLRGLRISTDSGKLAVDVTVQRLKKPENMKDLIIVVFEEIQISVLPVQNQHVSNPDCEQPEVVKGLEDELRTLQDRFTYTIREMEDSQEGFKATTAELQSTNEELQSTNEELNTAKEEIQSVNEELLTVNSELRVKNQQLLSSNDDMKNLLNSTNIITVFLDKELKIRSFTPQITEIINLQQSDIGRPVTDFATGL